MLSSSPSALSRAAAHLSHKYFGTIQQRGEKRTRHHPFEKDEDDIHFENVCLSICLWIAWIENSVCMVMYVYGLLFKCGLCIWVGCMAVCVCVWMCVESVNVWKRRVWWCRSNIIKSERVKRVADFPVFQARKFSAHSAPVQWENELVYMLC